VVHVAPADLDDPRDRDAVLEMTRDYARDPMGDARDLSAASQGRLIAGLRGHPTTLVFLAWDDTRPVGIATCFLGFSTFEARPLVNVHDLHVVRAYRRRGIGRLLLEAVEARARELGCCRLTLEVQERNRVALGLYERFGFVGGQYAPEAGAVLFRVKKL